MWKVFLGKVLMKNSDRYKVPSEEDYELGSKEVLKNYLGITKKLEIEAAEFQKFKEAEAELIKIFDFNHRFTAQDICNIHELWLGDIYAFAGKYRSVMMSKDGFPFAAPNCIAAAMKVFEKKYLAQYTPCHFRDDNELALALGITHVELILIHPFREGNGRTARLLADLMMLQANRPMLNFTLIDQFYNPDGFKDYILAIQASVGEEYGAIKEIFLRLIREKETI